MQIFKELQVHVICESFYTSCKVHPTMTISWTTANTPKLMYQSIQITIHLGPTTCIAYKILIMVHVVVGYSDCNLTLVFKTNFKNFPTHLQPSKSILYNTKTMCSNLCHEIKQKSLTELTESIQARDLLRHSSE